MGSNGGSELCRDQIGVSVGIKELAPIDIEIIGPDDLADITVVSEVGKDGEGICFFDRVNSTLSVASDLLEAAEGAILYKVKVPDGYTLHDLIPSKKDAESVRALVRDANGKINGDVSLKLNGVSPTQVATIGLAAAAMVVGQAYMTEISDSLDRIDSKLDTVVAMIAGEQKAKVKNAISIAKAYVNLHDDYASKPREAFQAARNEIESRYNEVGEVIDWIVEQLEDLEKRLGEAKPTEKAMTLLLNELGSYKEQFNLCLRALSALAMTRMYYDGCMDERSAFVERGRIEEKSQEFFVKWQRLSGIFELRIGEIKGAPIALPKASGNVVKRLASQTPRAAAKSKLLEAKVGMQSDLRKATSEAKANAIDCAAGIDRMIMAGKTARTMLTDGEKCWLIDDGSAA